MNLFIANECIACGSKDINSIPAVLMPFISHRVFSWKPFQIKKDLGFKSLKNGMAYSLCNSLRCNECGFLFLDIRFGDKELKNLYSKYRADDYVKLREEYEPGYAKRNSQLNEGYRYLSRIEKILMKFIPNKPKILDFGGGNGINTPFSNSALLAHSFDISDNLMVNKNVKKIDWDEALNTKYDLIFCSNVYEHLPVLSDTTKKICQIMNKKTYLYIEVPHEKIMVDYENLKSVLKLKRHWHEHINFFSQNSLREHFKMFNLKIIDFKSINVKSYNGKPDQILYIILKK